MRTCGKKIKKICLFGIPTPNKTVYSQTAVLCSGNIGHRIARSFLRLEAMQGVAKQGGPRYRNLMQLCREGRPDCVCLLCWSRLLLVITSHHIDNTVTPYHLYRISSDGVNIAQTRADRSASHDIGSGPLLSWIFLSHHIVDRMVSAQEERHILILHNRTYPTQPMGLLQRQYPPSRSQG